MSGLKKRTSRRTVTRPNARKAINRISTELEALIANSPANEARQHYVRTNMVAALNSVLSVLYAKGEK